jgi:hypothetical protein
MFNERERAEITWFRAMSPERQDQYIASVANARYWLFRERPDNIVKREPQLPQFSVLEGDR